jgi:hypothetical protein
MFSVKLLSELTVLVRHPHGTDGMVTLVRIKFDSRSEGTADKYEKVDTWVPSVTPASSTVSGISVRAEANFGAWLFASWKSIIN